MLGRLFISLSELPGLKKKLWRGWYEYLARSHRAADWTFMNYGYYESGAPTLPLDEADEADRHFIQLYEHVAGAVDLTGCRVLEVGSGRGGGSSFIRRYLQPAQITGVDLSQNAVEFSRARHHVDGLVFEVADAEHLPYSDGSFDAVVNIESSHCYPSFRTFLSEIYRVLRPGGVFLYADFRAQKKVEDWHVTMRAAQFAVDRETDITSNVIAALERDNDRKIDLINRLIPRLLRRSFLDFAAVRGSTVFEAFRAGELVYMSFVLRKA
jgi:ubiquinone/menaquinone biosynthesis C-methylase UbiE